MQNRLKEIVINKIALRSKRSALKFRWFFFRLVIKSSKKLSVSSSSRHLFGKTSISIWILTGNVILTLFKVLHCLIESGKGTACSKHGVQLLHFKPKETFIPKLKSRIYFNTFWSRYGNQDELEAKSSRNFDWSSSSTTKHIRTVLRWLQG